MVLKNSPTGQSPGSDQNFVLVKVRSPSLTRHFSPKLEQAFWNFVLCWSRPSFSTQSAVSDRG
ncbi:hypothetical protein, partial [Roseivivax sediminis]|uniref:hypothetical protein n=1 Tax=Roseivivax sediminis TaxID=936889 RepID=UPI001CB6E1A6